MGRILITGATGFVGARLLARLVGHGEVWALSRRRPAGSGVRWLQQDLAAEVWTAALPERIDAVVHLAQSGNFRDFPAKAVEIHAVSAGTTMRLLDWAVRAGATQFVLASTGGLYGAGTSPARESDPLPDFTGPLGFYFATKRASELLVEQYSRLLNGAILRYFFVYGSGQPQQMLMPRLVGSIAAGSPIQLQGEDGIRINPIHVDDAVRAIERCLELNNSGLFNVGGPDVASLREIAEIVGRKLGRSPEFVVDEGARPNHLVADIERMSRELGAPSVGLEVGIAELCGGAG